MDAQRLAVGSERHMSLTETMQLADLFVKSGMFVDVKNQAQAFVIIMAGRELGFSATASMMGINVLFGKPSLSADLIAALIKRDRRYSFNVVVHTANECKIEFMENGKVCHTETYTIEDAAKAGLVGKDIWKKHPRELLYARCISKGGNILCPQRMAGVDISEELSAPTEPVEATPEAAAQAIEELTGEKPTQQTTTPPVTVTRPFTAEQLKERFVGIMASCGTTSKNLTGFQGLVRAWLDLLFVGQADVEFKRHSITKFLFEKMSTADLTAQECYALKSWLKPVEVKDGSGGNWTLDSMAEKEAQSVILQCMLDAGQTELFADEQAEAEAGLAGEEQDGR